jgi:hypothetical protein
METAISLDPSATEELLEFCDNLDYLTPHLSLDRLTEYIKEGFLGYVKAGVCLEKVRYLKLWKQGYANFKGYCEKALGKSLSYINRIIEATQVCRQLIAAGFDVLPACEAQARPLVKFLAVDKGGNSELETKWGEVLQASRGSTITAELVKNIVDGEPQTQCKRIEIDSDVYQELEAKAKLAGLSPKALLKKLIAQHIPDEADTESNCEGDTESVTESKEQKFANWQKDLEELVQECDRDFINNDPTNNNERIYRSLETGDG